MEKLYVIMAQSRTGHNFVYHNFLSWNPDAPVARVEGYAPEAINYKLILSLNPELKIEGERDLVYFIVTRDFKNWLASYMMMWWGRRKKGIPVQDMELFYKNVDLERKIRVWKALDDEAHSAINIYLSPIVPIHYSDFKQDTDYRKFMCGLVGGTYTEDKLDFVPQGGGGSSFNGKEFQNRGNQMKTDRRFEQITGSEIEDYYNYLLTKYDY